MTKEDAAEYVKRIRQEYGAADCLRDMGLSTPDDVIRYDDLSYGTDDKELQKLDVYRPKNETGPLPLLISVHGGAWIYGTKEVYQYYCMSLAQQGFAVVNFSYRLAPEYQYPALFEDLNAVCEWAVRHQDEYGFDLNRVFAVGDSAGAHILSLYCCALTNEAYRKKAGYAVQKDLSFQAIALNCGAYSINEDPDFRKVMSLLMPKGGTRDELDLICPVLHITEGFPACFVMTASQDFLADQPKALLPVLKKHHIPYVYRMYGDNAHPLMHDFHVNIRLPEAGTCRKEELAFFLQQCIQPV